MNQRFQILSAIAEVGRGTVTQISEASGLPPHGMSTQLANLLAQCAIEIVGTVRGTFGRPSRVWAITPKGREILANPSAKRRVAPVVRIDDRADVREFYSRSHADHVERQRRAGIPERLIFGELLEPVSPAVR